MSVLRWLRPLAVSAFLGRRSLALRRLPHRLRRGPRRRVLAFLQVDDPYSVLLAQVLPSLATRGSLDVVLRLVPPPEPAFLPEPLLAARWALRDAAALSREQGLSFPEDAALPPPNAARSAAAEVARDPGLERLVEVGLRLFSGELDGATEPAPDLRGAAAQRRRLGHYQGGMLWYEGEWYWGLDRLPLLEERLRGEGVPLDPPSPTPSPRVGAVDAPPLELFFSFRSPYSYLALEPAFRLADDLGLDLRLRPVLPMVQRGLSVPRAKVLYIARDCARLARQQGQPFGRIADPLGPGIDRCLGLFVAAEGSAQQREVVRSLCRGIWAEGRDVAFDPHLRALAARAGLGSPSEEDVERGRSLAEGNRRDLLALGLWGVPSFRCGELTLWGQDRLGRLRRRLLGREPGGSAP